VSPVLSLRAQGVTSPASIMDPWLAESLELWLTLGGRLEVLLLRCSTAQPYCVHVEATEIGCGLVGAGAYAQVGGLAPAPARLHTPQSPHRTTVEGTGADWR